MTVRPKKRLGQHFLVDENVLGVIGRLAELRESDVVLEVGPGLGVLTRYLADRVRLVHAIELDRSLEEPLGEALGGRENVSLVFGDALKLDLTALEPAPRKLVANLPYNVGTPLLADLLDDVHQIARFVVMVQSEVADRLVAGPADGKAYGALSVKVASWARARRLATVPPSVFLPRPRVASAVVELVRHSQPVVPDDVDRDVLSALVRQAFGQRRKMLRRSLAGTVAPDAFERSGIDPAARPEALELSDWIELVRAVR